MSTFYIEIEMGNDAMQTSNDITNALFKVAGRLTVGQLTGKVLDENGNSVGTFGFRSPPSKKKEPEG